MELELEGFFKRGLWVTTRDGKIGAKKKYALLGEDGKIKIRGFETVRRDWCALAREIQNKIILDVLKYGNSEKALKYLKKTQEIDPSHSQANLMITYAKKMLALGWKSYDEYGFEAKDIEGQE